MGSPRLSTNEKKLTFKSKVTGNNLDVPTFGGGK